LGRAASCEAADWVTADAGEVTRTVRTEATVAEAPHPPLEGELALGGSQAGAARQQRRSVLSRTALRANDLPSVAPVFLFLQALPREAAASFLSRKQTLSAIDVADNQGLEARRRSRIGGGERSRGGIGARARLRDLPRRRRARRAWRRYARMWHRQTKVGRRSSVPRVGRPTRIPRTPGVVPGRGRGEDRRPERRRGKHARRRRWVWRRLGRGRGRERGCGELVGEDAGGGWSRSGKQAGVHLRRSSRQGRARPARPRRRGSWASERTEGERREEAGSCLGA